MKLSINEKLSEHGTSLSVEFGTRTIDIQVEKYQLNINNYDFAVWLVLLCAMREKVDIEIDFPVSKELIYNTRLMQNYLHHYLKWPYINIYCQTHRKKKPTTSIKRILPFSGGVDSCFSLLYNTFELKRSIHSVFMAEGFELLRGHEYQWIYENCKKIVNPIGANIIKLNTNFKARCAMPGKWKLHSDFLLAALLHLFDEDFEVGFISGGGDGGDLSIEACFKTPFLNERLFFLFSNSDMLIDKFEGADHTRVQKIEYLARFSDVKRYLRVCWEGRKHFNCGKCRKCVMTQLSFWAATGTIPSCFPVQADEIAVRSVLSLISSSRGVDPDSPNIILPKQLREILMLADKNDIHHKYFELIDSFLKKSI